MDSDPRPEAIAINPPTPDVDSSPGGPLRSLGSERQPLEEPRLTKTRMSSFENTPEDELRGYDRELKAAVDQALRMLKESTWQFTTEQQDG